MQTEKEKYWFRAKKVGWGWGLPCAWQGWMVLIAFLVLINGSIPFLLPEHMAAWIAGIVILCIVLVAICFAKGEKPGRSSREE